MYYMNHQDSAATPKSNRRGAKGATCQDGSERLRPKLTNHGWDG